MDKQIALTQMISPSKHRKGKPLGGVIQIWITRACGNSCWGCTQGSNFAGNSGMISTGHFRQACESLQDYFGVIGLIGGNPTLHPKFSEICSILREYFPKEKCGLWSNHPRGNGKVAQETFNPSVSNLNVHLSQDAYNEFKRDWPKSNPFGLEKSSRHSPPYVAIKDVVNDMEEMWGLIADCDINRHWSAMIVPFRGELRGYFCEIAAAQAVLHQYEEGYPDLGIPIKKDWWDHGMEFYASQVFFHCSSCGIPLRIRGQLAEEKVKPDLISKTHQSIAVPKISGKHVLLVTDRKQIEEQACLKVTDYLGNAKR